MIAIDAVPAAKQQKTGVEWYVYHLIKAMMKLAPELEVVCYSHQPLDFEMEGNWKNTVLKWPFPGWSKLRFTMELGKVQPEVVFIPGHEIPTVPKTSKVLTTVHDLAFRTQPELYTKVELVNLERAHKRAVERADKIVAVCEQTKTDLLRGYNVDPERIEVVHLGFDVAAFHAREEDDAEVQRVREQYQLNKPYFLFVGRLSTQKGVATLLQAFKRWQEVTGNEVLLALAGKPGAKGYEQIHELATESSWVRELGHVASEDLGPLYSGAHAFVLPSRKEGFGMPIIEAMASGLPVACSDLPVLHEVGGNMPLFVPVDDVQAWQRALESLWDGEHRAMMKMKGLARASEFSWEKTARKTLTILRELHAGHETSD